MAHVGRQLHLLFTGYFHLSLHSWRIDFVHHISKKAVHVLTRRWIALAMRAPVGAVDLLEFRPFFILDSDLFIPFFKAPVMNIMPAAREGRKLHLSKGFLALAAQPADVDQLFLLRILTPVRTKEFSKHLWILVLVLFPLTDASDVDGVLITFKKVHAAGLESLVAEIAYILNDSAMLFFSIVLVG